MTRRAMKLAAAAVATAGALALTGCGYITVASEGGTGTCDGTPFTLTTSQNAAGDEITISYTGPSDVALVMNHGFYTDSAAGQLSPLANFGAGNDSQSNSDVRVLRFDTTEPGWGTSGSGNSTSYTFTGTVQTLIDGQDTAWVSSPGSDVERANAVIPAVIGVSCDSSVQTSDFTAADVGVPVDGIEYAAARMIFPNNMQLNPYEVVSAIPQGDGTVVTFRFTDQALIDFGSFVPDVPTEAGVAQDLADVPNTSLTNMWIQAAAVGDTYASVPQANGDGTFSILLSGPNGPVGGGNFILTTVIPDANQPAAKVVFTSLYLNAYGAVADDPFNPTEEPAPAPSPSSPAAPAALATTGTDANGIVAALTGALALVGAGGLLTLARRRTA